MENFRKRYLLFVDPQEFLRLEIRHIPRYNYGRHFFVLNLDYPALDEVLRQPGRRPGSRG